MEVAGNGNCVVDDARGAQLIDEHGDFHTLPTQLDPQFEGSVSGA
jgi:hypothetical protein